MIKNIFTFAQTFANLFIHRSHSFVQTINGTHLNVAVVSMSGKPAVPGYSLAAAGLIAASVSSGQPGSFKVPVGGTELYQVTVTPIADIPPMTTYNAPSA
jgi:hypothetical protein